MNAIQQKRLMSKRFIFRDRRTHQKGGTLIEVLVSILIFSFGLVGLIGLQARAMQISTSAEDTSRASLLANELAVSMITGQTISLAPGVITAWQARVADVPNGGLPNGTGATAISGNVATITVSWEAPSSAGSSFNAVSQYVTQVVIP